MSLDYDGATRGSTMGADARVTVPNVSVPVGAMHIGCHEALAREFHGALAIGLIPKVLSDAEYTALRAQVLGKLTGLVLQ